LRDRLVRPFRNAWKADIRTSTSPLRDEVARLTQELTSLRQSTERELATLRATLDDNVQRAQRAERDALLVRQIAQLNEAHAPDLARLEQSLDAHRIVAHVRAAIAGATLHLDPFPHIVVESLFPDDTYRLLLKAVPPPLLFSQRDPIKQNCGLPVDFGPALSLRVWAFVQETIALGTICPAVRERFAVSLADYLDRTFGDRAPTVAGLAQSTSGSRLMLRRPGYTLAAHRDPKRTLFTCLMYLAKPGDNPDFGTDIYRVDDDAEAPYTETYYPQQEGRPCTWLKTVPFRPNSMLIFLNSGGAHGARIPADAPPSTERLSWQFYIGPDAGQLHAVLDQLPEAQRRLWRPKRERAVPAGA
jgi:hypothetical protein